MPSLKTLLLDRLATLPGMESASLADWVPLGYSWDAVKITPEGYVPQAHENMMATSMVMSPGYFSTLQIPLMAGRDFNAMDTEKSEDVAVVNQELVNRYWPHQDAIGKEITIGETGSKLRVVGVVRNSNFGTLNEAPQPAVYVNAFQAIVVNMTVHARVAGDPMGLRSQHRENDSRVEF